MNERPVTLRLLAKRLGVSSATVSLALRNSPTISAPVRKRVQAMAKKLNYRGNILINALMTQVRRGRVGEGGEVIGLLLEGDRQPTAPGIVEGVEAARERAGLAGLRLDTFLLGRRGGDSASVNRMLFSRGIRGVIVGLMPLDLLPLAVEWDRYACMAIGYSFQQVMMHRVANAHFQGLLTCYEKLRKSGCERIGCVLGSDEDERSRHYWQAAARSAPHLFGGTRIAPLMMDLPVKRSSFETWFRRYRPQAVIGNHPDHVAGWLAELNLEARYVTLDWYAGQPWSGIHQSWAEMFATSVDQLAGKLARNEFGLPVTARTTLIEGVWTEGAARPSKVTA
jgi:DNA-binding LacI/PurR family transcriptional regulator